MAHVLGITNGKNIISLGNYMVDNTPNALSLEEVLSNPQATMTNNLEAGPLPTARIQAIQAAFAQARLRNKSGLATGCISK